MNWMVPNGIFFHFFSVLFIKNETMLSICIIYYSKINVNCFLHIFEKNPARVVTFGALSLTNHCFLVRWFKRGIYNEVEGDP